MTTEQRKRMDELQKTLKEASAAYYNGEELMSNREYDALYDELVSLEKETGEVDADSITMGAGAEAVNELPKVRHEFPALSLDKTKDASELTKVMDKGRDSCCLMWKMDGSTVVATYDNGRLTRLATRGNGEVGNDITHNAPYLYGLPAEIPYKGHMVVRGEAIMTYREFNRINEELPFEDRYKNPRNLANATITMLDSKEMRKRKIEFYGFHLTYAENMDELASVTGVADARQTFSSRLAALEALGFQVVENFHVANRNLERAVESWTDAVKTIDFPVDGLVVANEDVLYAESQPGTGHNPNRLVGFAFKWQDELVQTKLRGIEWSVGRTGVITPVALFDPVEICGTTVSRASMHNLSEMYRILGYPFIGQPIEVYKANMIIPQVESGRKDFPMTAKAYSIGIPGSCPCCNRTVVQREEPKSKVRTLVCENDECPARHIGKLEHFAGREGLDIRGFSGETIGKLVNAGVMSHFEDFFHLGEHPEVADIPGFGKKSYQNLVDAAKKARETNFQSFLVALGIDGIGKGQAKVIDKYLKEHYFELSKDLLPKNMTEENFDYDKPVNLFLTFAALVSKNYDFAQIDGIGAVLDGNIKSWGKKNIGSKEKAPDNLEVGDVLFELCFTDRIPTRNKENSLPLEGKTFVITGSLEHFANREEMVAEIERSGGKVSGSVSAKTSYLINNDRESTSGKNKKAKELGIPIISENEALSMMGKEMEQNEEETEEVER